MNKLNKGQAMVPKNCTVINNPVGSASVSWFERDGKVLVSMPGVPQEMTTVMAESVLPKLHERFQTDVIMHQTFLVQHYPESVLAEKLEAWEVALPDCIKLAYPVSYTHLYISSFKRILKNLISRRNYMTLSL